MRTLFSNKITVFKIFFMLGIAVLAVVYNVNLFTADANKNTINIKDIYLKYGQRKKSIYDVSQLMKVSKKLKEPSKQTKQLAENKSSQTSLLLENMPAFSKKQYIENEKTIVGSIESINDISVQKDELVYVKFIDLDIPDINSETNHKDEYASNMLLRVEFWKSPVNFSGYKKQKNKIILYGIDDFDEVNFKFANNKLCLQYGNGFFEIEEANDFRRFCPISDKNLIAILIEDEP